MSEEKTKELTQAQKTKAIFEREDVKIKLKEMLGKRASGFTTSVLSAINTNEMLKNADSNSVYMAAMMAASLDLPINQNLGFAYIIPYNRKTDQGYKQFAQFQVGYKGFIQLALRSGQFETISATEVYEGELISSDRLKGYQFDWDAKISDKIIGYAAYMELKNGFKKTLFMTREQLLGHGEKYSKTFKHKSGLWTTNFDSMARKTVLKLLLSKFGLLSVEMQKAAIVDQSVINDYENPDNPDYVDNPDFSDYEEVDPMIDRISQMIDKAKKVDDLDKISADVEIPAELVEKFNEKRSALEK